MTVSVLLPGGRRGAGDAGDLRARRGRRAAGANGAAALREGPRGEARAGGDPLCVCRGLVSIAGIETGYPDTQPYL